MGSGSPWCPMKQSSPINPATLYSGRSRHALDTSNRIMLNSSWRPEGSPDRFLVVLKKGFLEVCPEDVFRAFLTELREKTADKTLIQHMERHLTERVQP